MTSPGTTEDLLRELAPQVLAALLRRYGYGQFYLCEDATQEALLAAAVQWPADGQAGNPCGWLVTVAARKLLDQVRSEQSRRQREERIAVAAPQSELLAAAPDVDAPPGTDDSLILLFGCCHPAISTPSQIANTTPSGIAMNTPLTPNGMNPPAAVRQAVVQDGNGQDETGQEPGRYQPRDPAARGAAVPLPRKWNGTPPSAAFCPPCSISWDGTRQPTRG